MRTQSIREDIRQIRKIEDVYTDAKVNKCLDVIERQQQVIDRLVREIEIMKQRIPRK